MRGDSVRRVIPLLAFTTLLLLAVTIHPVGAEGPWSVRLTPSTDVPDGSNVTVDGAGFTPGIQVSALQCPPGWSGGYGCVSQGPYLVAPDGTVTARFPARRFLPNYATEMTFDCSTSGQPCILGFLMSESPYNESAFQPITVRPRNGYWMLGSTGTVYAFGDAGQLGNPPGISAANIAATPTGNGYWVVSRGGDLYTFGDAWNANRRPSLEPGESIASISSTPTGSGYWLFSDRGDVFVHGSAKFFGSLGSITLNGPVLGSVATPSGQGYYMVANDGGIFAFGDAVFRGSMGDQRLNAPVVGLAPDPDGAGYWLVASDGGIFAFDAPFKGSMGGTALNKPVIGMVAYGDGYLMVASDGGIFNFSSKPFAGSLGSSPPANPIVAVAPLPG